MMMMTKSVLILPAQVWQRRLVWLRLLLGDNLYFDDRLACKHNICEYH